MLPIKISNIPHMDRPGRGADRGPHLYLFFDPNLADNYGRLTLPSKDHKQEPDGMPLPSALTGTWFGVQFDRYGTGRGAIKRWPFASTAIESAKDCFHSDGGRLPEADLGANVVHLLEDEGILDKNSAGSREDERLIEPQDVGQASKTYPSVLQPDIVNVRTGKYRLVVSAGLREVFRLLSSCMVTTKNEAIERVNKIDNNTDLGTKYLHSLHTELCNNKSDFVSSRNFQVCPSHIRRAAVLEAVSARKAISTKHSKLSREKRSSTEIPDIKPVVLKRDSGIGLTLPANQGYVAFSPEPNTAAKPQRAAQRGRSCSSEALSVSGRSQELGCRSIYRHAHQGPERSSMVPGFAQVGPASERRRGKGEVELGSCPLASRMGHPA